MGIILTILVCIDVVSNIEKTLTDDDKKDITLIEDKISAYCKQKKLSQEQKKIVLLLLTMMISSAITSILSREKFLFPFLTECPPRMFASAS